MYIKWKPAILKYIGTTYFTLIFINFILPMNPVGKFLSVLTLPSTLINLCMVIFFTSSYVKAYLRRFLKNTMRGSDSLSLWGPVLGRGAYKSRKKGVIVNLRYTTDKQYDLLQWTWWNTCLLKIIHFLYSECRLNFTHRCECTINVMWSDKFGFTLWHQNTYEDTSEFVQHPWFGRCQALQNLLASSITL